MSIDADALREHVEWAPVGKVAAAELLAALRLHAHASSRGVYLHSWLLEARLRISP